MEKNKNSQVRKNYKKYKKSNINIETSNNDNILKLWTDVLYIDKNSWKNEEKSDMKSLDREDLQYIFYMLNNKDKISLNVSYNNKIPTSYSLMFKENNNKWYAVKWGASFLGREKYHGIYCLYDHLIKLSDKQEINIDFWGRRSESYDYLKNNSLKRYHIILKKE